MLNAIEKIANAEEREKLDSTEILQLIQTTKDPEKTTLYETIVSTAEDDDAFREKIQLEHVLTIGDHSADLVIKLLKSTLKGRLLEIKSETDSERFLVWCERDFSIYYNYMLYCDWYFTTLGHYKKDFVVPFQVLVAPEKILTPMVHFTEKTYFFWNKLFRLNIYEKEDPLRRLLRCWDALPDNLYDGLYKALAHAIMFCVFASADEQKLAFSNFDVAQIANLRLIGANKSVFTACMDQLLGNSPDSFWFGEGFFQLLDLIVELGYFELIPKFVYHGLTQEMFHSDDLDTSRFSNIEEYIPNLRSQAEQEDCHADILLLLGDYYIITTEEYRLAVQFTLGAAKAGNAIAVSRIIDLYLPLLANEFWNNDGGLQQLFFKLFQDLLTIDPYLLLELMPSFDDLKSSPYKTLFTISPENVQACKGLIKAKTSYADYQTPTGVVDAEAEKVKKIQLALDNYKLYSHASRLLNNDEELYQKSIQWLKYFVNLYTESGTGYLIYKKEDGKVQVLTKKEAGSYFADPEVNDNNLLELDEFLELEKGSNALRDENYYLSYVDIKFKAFVSEYGDDHEDFAYAQRQIVSWVKEFSTNIPLYFSDYYAMCLYLRYQVPDEATKYAKKILDDSNAPIVLKKQAKFQYAQTMMSLNFSESQDPIDTAIKVFEFVYDAQDDDLKQLRENIIRILNGDGTLLIEDSKVTLKMPPEIMQRFVEYYEKAAKPDSVIATVLIPAYEQALAMQKMMDRITFKIN